MKRKDAIQLFNVLTKVQDKNKIKDSQIRMAIIKNFLALKPAVEAYSTYMRDLRAQYDTPESLALSKEIQALSRRLATAASEIEKRELAAEITGKQIDLDRYFAPVQPEFDKLAKEYDEEEIALSIQKVPLEALDAATSEQPFSTSDIAHLSPMLEI